MLLRETFWVKHCWVKHCWVKRDWANCYHTLAPSETCERGGGAGWRSPPPIFVRNYIKSEYFKSSKQKITHKICKIIALEQFTSKFFAHLSQTRKIKIILGGKDSKVIRSMIYPGLEKEKKYPILPMVSFFFVTIN